MSYQALYRQYRPAAFGAVIGQEHITTILKNQVRSGHVAHAYLFSGTRGTGKTTTARIFARALNCLSPAEGEPCEQCSACLASAAENSDIVELDAASNSSVDDIRALVEKARYTPMQLSTKVYIIDEAHALASSNQAFNALLKTLEEPPAHLVFILATTEPQKLPSTIRSRCQRLDFRRLRTADMVGLLREVVEKNGVSMEEEGLLAIARAADGGMRDALSLADQCLAFCGKQISAQDVYRVLGSMDGAFLFRMADALIRGDARGALVQLAELVAQGRDLGVFAHDLLLHMRALLLSRICGLSEELLDCSGDDARRYYEQSQSCGEARLLRAVELLSPLQGELKWLAAPRARVESTLVRIAQPDGAQCLEDLAARIELLEARLQGAAAVPVEAPSEKPVQRPAPAEDLPPWEEAPPPAEAPPADDAPPWEEAAPSTAPPPRAEKTRRAAPQNPQNADARWQAVLEKLKGTDMLLYGMAKNAAASMDENGLTLSFGADIYANAVKKSIGAISELAGCPVRIQKAAAGEASLEERARALFGDMLKITD